MSTATDSGSDDWRPSSSLSVARRRAKMLQHARQFFSKRNVLEVETPLLAKTTVTDPQIESVRAELTLDSSRRYFLQTSPEYFMKRLLCSGYPDIFQIGKAFRDEEAGQRHQPEFTLVEWYRRAFDLVSMMQETVDFVSLMVGSGVLSSPPLFLEYRDALQQHAHVDPLDADLDTLKRTAGADDRLSASLGSDRNAWLDLLLSMQVMPRFGKDGLTVVYHYPRSQAALARLCPADPRVADRFEIFFGDLELANGFVELQSADEQRHRFENDRQLRRARAKSIPPLDRQLLAALESGLPDCAGVAVGLDRLLMVKQMTNDIRHVQSFSFERGDRLNQ